MNTAQQANSEPLVTIGLPTFNRPEGLDKCLHSIASQTYRNLEIIISDNCSTDERVQQVITKYADADKRIKAIRQDKNIGLEENFNAVFKLASANYFTWMSDDDYFDANYIEACVKFLEQNPDHILCSGVAKYYAGDHYLFTERMFQTDQSTPFKRLLQYFSKVNKNGNFYGVFRNRLFLDKPVNPHIGCDWTFMAKLAILGKLGYVETTAYHRSAEGNSGTRKKMIKKFGFNKLQALFFETYSAYLVTRNIFRGETVKNKLGPITRLLAAVLIFIRINYNSLVQFIYKLRGKNYFSRPEF